jgi:hypothetical protein
MIDLSLSLGREGRIIQSSVVLCIKYQWAKGRKTRRRFDKRGMERKRKEILDRGNGWKRRGIGTTTTTTRLVVGWDDEGIEMATGGE